MTKKTVWIIALQTFLIIVMFWVLVFVGKDEYEANHAGDEEEIDGPARVQEQQGLQVVKVNLATQKNSGILVHALQPYIYQGNIKALGTVISVQPLIDYSNQYQQLKSQRALAESVLPHHQLQFQRYRQLNEDDKNVSDKVMQEAQALVVNDQTQINTSQMQIRALEDTIKAQWGNALSKMIIHPEAAGELNDLLAQKRVLVQVSYPLNMRDSETHMPIQLIPIQDQTAPITAHYVSQSIQSDISNLGKTFFYSAPSENLRIGMRVNVVASTRQQGQHAGVNIPNEAIVWHGGMAWVYVKAGEDTFLRKPVSAATEIEGGWFDDSLQPGTEVITRGAQLLLSEEFKFQIKNENED